MKMKTVRTMTILIVITIMALVGCATTKAKIVELENKGTVLKASTPTWVNNYVKHGISKVQAQSEFKDRYCVIGEESGVNRQFVTTWADNFSAQQRIGAMLRTTIVSEYRAHVQGKAQTIGGANSTTVAGENSGEFNQEIDSIVNAIVDVSYSGAQRESDWWSLRRRYDPDNKTEFTDEYIVYVLYIIPKAEMNRQVAKALETSVKADSALYDITIEMARSILQNGLARWGEELSN